MILRLPNFKISKKNIDYFISFWTIGGFFAFQIFFLSAGIKDSRTLTVPLRIILSLFMIYRIIENRSQPLNKLSFTVLLFWFVYLSKIIWHLADKNLPIKSTDYLFYFVSFAFLPFIYYLTLPKSCLSQIKKAFIHSIIFLSILAFYYYASFFLMGVARLDLASYYGIESNTISPLSIAYGSSFAICLGLYNVINGKNTKYWLSLIIISIIPFFLGASRGALLAVIFPIFILLANSKGQKNYLFILLLFTTLIISFLYVDQTNGGSFSRRMSLVFQQTEENPRILLWKETINQLMESPIIGNHIYLKTYNSYPHNLILEGFLTTGVIFGLLFFIFFITIMRKSVARLNFIEKDYWLLILLIQSGLQGMVSGNLYSSIWFWSCAGLFLNLNRE